MGGAAALAVLNGWSLCDTQITRASRLDRLMLILAIAYLLLCGIGLIALERCKPGDWSSSSKNDCSVFTIGKIMLNRIRTTAAQTAQALLRATEQAVPNWG